jgi:hypothetical protein
MTRQIIRQGGKPAFVVIPIDEWRRIEATLEDRVDAAAVNAFRKTPSETFPDALSPRFWTARIRSRHFASIAA